jgi:transposase-like protein
MSEKLDIKRLQGYRSRERSGKTQRSVAERSFPSEEVILPSRSGKRPLKMSYNRLSLSGEGYSPCREVPVSLTLEGKQMEHGNGKTQKRRLSAEEKWQIYQECEQPEAKVGEILRKYRLYSSDLQNIRRDVRDGALERLRQSRPGRKKVTAVPREEHEQLKEDLAEKEKALAELSVLFTALKKKVNLE